MTCSQTTPVAVPSSSFFMLAVRVLSFDDSAVASGELPEQLMLQQQQTISAFEGQGFIRTLENNSCGEQFVICWTLLTSC